MPTASWCCIPAKSSPWERWRRFAPIPACRRSTLALLEVKRLDAGYGRARILFDVSLELGAGEVVMLAGRNGAGKSTTLKAVMGLIERTGDVSCKGQRI